ncbi:tripartite tricarboxylate transporter permease [Chelativorans sp. Marseille-P2723]|uniref:tripartite tricarboxylate transporter permease n=1 Tax=Chelativorans sp. Marseille-P2723 TaxID=2709133 RepID=UPI00156EC6B4|nr:tripartite tricarboxylate transporter permease [Chelativorans sp. Marseille-P2723]
MTGQLLDHLALGFSVSFSLQNLLLCLLGCLVGTLIGVLPGIGPLATIAILLPITYNVDPVGALIMLAGIYYGAQYGGSTTAILVNMPGEASSVVTTLDGHAMAKEGRAGKALGIAAIGSFIAGTFGVLVVAALATPLAGIALSFTASNYFALMVLGLTLAVVLAGGSLIKASCMLIIGVTMALVGADPLTAEPRLTFGLQTLYDRVELGIVAMGLFGIAEILRNLELREARPTITPVVGRLLPDRDDFRQSAGAIGRGSLLGSILGILPGNGVILASFASYALEKRLAKDPSRFGKGAIEGVAGPESANNSGAQTAFVPLLTLGLPATATMALMAGAMMLHGVLPGPQMMDMHPEMFWGVVTSMWLGNAMLVIINLPLIGIWVKLLRVPYRLLFPAIVFVCCTGIFSVGLQPADVIQVGIFGLAGYLLSKLKLEAAPLLLGLVLGSLLENNLRRGLVLARGDFVPFLSDPLTLVLLALSMIIVITAVLPAVAHRREEIPAADD